MNQYVLNESLFNENSVTFESYTIRNFVDGGEAIWSIHKLGTDQIEPVFDVAVPGKPITALVRGMLVKE